MRKKTLSALLIPILILVLCSVGLAQRQTGSLRGTIVDEQGNPLPGVTVTVTSPALQGQETFVSTAEGDFRFPSLPPGEYTIRGELTGFQKIDRPGVIVSVGKAVSVIIQMKMATVEEEVTITAAAPVVDVQSSNVSVTIDKDMIKTIPVRRNILDLYRMAPGTTGQSETYDYQRQSVVHGGAVQESKISIDGVDLIDPMRGYALADVAFDAVDEVEISLGGHKAEVGQVMAGYVNVVSKSGGNRFSGSVTGVFNTKDITQNVVPLEQIEAAGLEHPITWNYKRDIGGDFGGPIFKDKLWFYVSPRYNDRLKNTAFVPFKDVDGVSHPAWDFTHSEIAGLGKITATLAKNMKWTGMYEYYKDKDHPDPWDVYEKYMSWEAVSGQVMNDMGHVFSSILTYIINQNAFAEFRVGYVFKTLELHQENAEGPQNRPYTYDEYTELQWGPAIGGEWYDKKSLTLNLNVTKFQDNFLGMNHEFKAGVEYGRVSSTSEYPLEVWQSSYVRYWWNGTPWAYQESEPYAGYFEIIMGDKKKGDMPREYGVWRYGGFVQDSLNIGKRFTLNVGLRYDEYHGFKKKEILKGWTDPNNGLANILLPQIFTKVDLTSPAIDDIMVFKNLSPRIGGTLDLFGNGKTALKASYARYREVLMGEQISGLDAFGNQPWIGFDWYDDNHNGKFDLPPTDRYYDTGYTAYTPSVEDLKKKIDPNTSAPYTDEFILGIQQELVKDFSLSLDFVYKDCGNFQGRRNLANPITSNVWIPYTVKDPGWDGTLGTGDDQNLTVYAKKREAAPDILQKTNIKEAWRKYWGIDFILYKRMSNNWMLSANFTYSKAWGNQPHGYHSHIGSFDWDNPNNLINIVRRLEFDRPILLKLMSTVILPYDIRASVYYRYTSGSPWARTVRVYFPSKVQGFSPKSASVSGVNAEPVGTRRTVPELNNFDMRVEKEFKAGPGRLGIWLEVFNLFGYYTYNFSQDPGGYIYANGTFLRYSSYGQVRSAEGYRTVNFALRYTF